MSNPYDPEDPLEIDKWTRTHYKITDERTEDFLSRNGFYADTPRGLAKRLDMALAWVQPMTTEQTAPLVKEIKEILSAFERRVSVVVGPEQKIELPAPLTEADRLQLEKGQVLFEQVMALHRLQPAADAQQKYKQTQRERAKKPRAPLLDEDTCKRIAKLYWDSKRDGTSYGLVKHLAGRYEVTSTTIQNIVKKYKSDSIDK